MGLFFPASMFMIKSIILFSFDRNRSAYVFVYFEEEKVLQKSTKSMNGQKTKIIFCSANRLIEFSSIKRECVRNDDPTIDVDM